MSKKKTHEEYLNEVAKKNPDIEVIGTYIDSHTPITHKCLKHDIIWEANPYSILRGSGCVLCKGEKIGNSKRKTNSQYLDEVNNINSNIEVSEPYINIDVPITHKCKIDGYIWKVSPSSILHGSGCPKCAGNIKKTKKRYEQELAKTNPNVKIIGDYLGNNVKTKHLCLIHNIEWDTTPVRVLAGCGCPHCHRERFILASQKKHEQYVSEVKEINPNIEVIDQYKGARTPIKHKCLKDEYVWEVTPNDILSGRGCPICNESKGERQIGCWLDKNNIKFKRQYCFADCKDKKVLPFDFYLPSQNICIEFDGEQHRKPIGHFGGEEAFKIRIKHDQIKTQYCEENNIKLLRINNVKDINKKLNNFLLA